LITWSGSPIAPAWYVIACCASTVIALAAIPEMARRQIDV
jgi:hypothetical protein